MKWNTLAILSAIHAASAQRWELRNCDDKSPDVLRGAVKEAITIAKDAVDVLENQGGDEKVQSIAKAIFGEDGWEEPLKKAQDHLKGVASYDDTETQGLLDDNVPRTNKDLGILCGRSHWGETSGDEAAGEVALLYNSYTMVIEALAEAGDTLQVLQTCHDQDLSALPEGTPEGKFVVAFVSRSDMFDDARYRADLAAGTPEDTLDYDDYLEPQPDCANTMDFCAMFLDKLGEGKYWTTVSDELIAKVQDEAFIKALGDRLKPIDTIQGSVPFTMLHELSHTTLGGKTDDIDYPNCYQWICVTKQKNPDNADTVAMLGLSLHLFKRGILVDKDGKLNKM